MNRLEEIKRLYAPYIDDPQYVYKMVLDQWIIIMKKLPYTQTNELRRNVLDPLHAKFRADKLEVCVIFNVLNPSETTRSVINTFPRAPVDIRLTYEINRIVRPDKFDKKLDAICSSGIHYFKSIESAFYYGRWQPRDYTGKWIIWRENGQLARITDCIEGMITHATHYYEDGQMKVDCNYLDYKKTGQSTAWYVTGHIKSQGRYLNDMKTGYWIEWDWCGSTNRWIKTENNYLNGQVVECSKRHKRQKRHKIAENNECA